jgi:hypothetical protein
MTVVATMDDSGGVRWCIGGNGGGVGGSCGGSEGLMIAEVMVGVAWYPPRAWSCPSSYKV